jgi:divalent metal cation (Fe/Co/Zn/Cd) transporter
MLGGKAWSVNQIETVKSDACADECCAPPPLDLPTRPGQPGERQALIRQAFRLEWLTIGWMSVEAVVAISAGLAAGSLVLTAFGLDSIIELVSAGVLIWRLTVELRRGERFSEETERTAGRIAGALLLALAVYVTVAAAWSLWTRAGEAFSWPGLVVALVAIPSMRYLARQKIAVAEKLGSRALRADAMEAVTCGWLSFVVVISLAAQWTIRAWWIEGVASLAIVWLLVKEGREAWAGRDCC